LKYRHAGRKRRALSTSKTHERDKASMAAIPVAEGRLSPLIFSVSKATEWSSTGTFCRKKSLLKKQWPATPCLRRRKAGRAGAERPRLSNRSAKRKLIFRSSLRTSATNCLARRSRHAPPPWRPLSMSRISSMLRPLRISMSLVRIRWLWPFRSLAVPPRSREALRTDQETAQTDHYVTDHELISQLSRRSWTTQIRSR
jgi:hypothetical protein